jgi:hypothetical protein
MCRTSILQVSDTDPRSVRVKEKNDFFDTCLSCLTRFGHMTPLIIEVSVLHKQNFFF